MPSLEAAEERWRLTIDSAPIGVSLADLEGRFYRANDTLCQMLGYEREELLALTFQELTHPEDLQEDLAHGRRLLAGQEQSFRIRKRYRHARGHYVWVDLSVAVVRGLDGTPQHTVGYVVDLTDQVEATTRLEQSNADLEAFATLVSHDLQAPLTTVHGYLQLLQSEYADQLDAQAHDWIRRVDGAARRMSGLVESMLSLSRAEAQPVRVPLSVADLVVEVCADLDPLITEYAAEVEVAEEQLMVLADPARLRQVLQNLVQNALKHRHPDRTPNVLVTVREAEHPAQGWVITVDDNGAGVPADRREAVFGLFTRLGNDDNGHGVGLAACRRIVERHGGAIWIEDNPQGHGSRFALTLPS